MSAKAKAPRGARKGAAGAATADHGSEYLLAAGCLAILAYPSEDKIPQRDKFVLAARAHLVKMFLGRGWMTRAENRSPKLSAMPNKKIEDTISAGWRRIRSRRMPAAELFMLEYFSVKDPVDSIRKLMMKAEIIHRIEDEAESAKKNISERVRRESMPVLHIAVALLNALPRPGAERKVGVYILLNNPRWVLQVQRCAEAWRKIITLHPRYKDACSARLPRVAE